jgi:methionyl-tRNA formyltransferase
MAMRFALIGRTRWLLEAGQQLIDAGHVLALVASAPGRPEYRADLADFEEFARERAAMWLNSPSINEAQTIAAMKQGGADIAISVNWPTLIGAAACGVFPHGILNAHAGDLPRYRGNACPNWAILNGESTVGLCIHAMAPEALDAGPIYVRRHLPLGETVDIADVYAWLDQTIPDAFVEALQLAVTPGFTPEPQQTQRVAPLRCYPRRPEDGRIDWRTSAEQIARLVRASTTPFAGAYCWIDGKERVVLRRVKALPPDPTICAVPGQILGRDQQGAVLVACGHGRLAVQISETETGRPLPGANSYRLTSTIWPYGGS